MQIAGLKLCKRLLRATMHHIFDMHLLQDHVLRWGVYETRHYVLKHVCSVAVHTELVLPTESCASFWTDTLDGRTGHHNILRIWHNVTSSIGSTDDELGLHSGAAHGVRFMGAVIAQVSEEYCTPGAGRSVVAQPYQKQTNMVSRMKPWVRLIVQGADASQISSIRGVSCILFSAMVCEMCVRNTKGVVLCGVGMC